MEVRVWVVEKPWSQEYAWPGSQIRGAEVPFAIPGCESLPDPEPSAGRTGLVGTPKAELSLPGLPQRKVCLSARTMPLQAPRDSADFAAPLSTGQRRLGRADGLHLGLRSISQWTQWYVNPLWCVSQPASGWGKDSQSGSCLPKLVEETPPTLTDQTLNKPNQTLNWLNRMNRHLVFAHRKFSLQPGWVWGALCSI